VTEYHRADAGAPWGQRVVAAFGNRLRAPLDQFATLEVAAKQRMELHSLQQAMDVQRAVQVVQADHETERDEVRRQRVHEAAAEGIARQRPPQRVDDRVERLPRLPQLLDAEREELRILARHTLPRAPRLGQEVSYLLRLQRHIGLVVTRVT